MRIEEGSDVLVDGVGVGVGFGVGLVGQHNEKDGRNIGAYILCLGWVDFGKCWVGEWVVMRRVSFFRMREEGWDGENAEHVVEMPSVWGSQEPLCEHSVLGMCVRKVGVNSGLGIG